MIELNKIKNKSITIIKRDGREEQFSKAKLSKVCNWASDDNKQMTNILLRDTEIKITKDRIKITTLYNNLINTAISKISMIQSDWQYVASKLYLLKLYTDAYGIKDKKYPHLKDVIKKGISAKIYKKEIFDYYTEEDIEYLNNVIRPEEDYTFTYNALLQFNSKYCKNANKSKKLELPQLTYMRVALGLCYNFENRVELAEELYNILTKGQATLATPMMMNSGTPLHQYSSCILNTIGNDSWDIANKLATAALYTKGRGGLGFDISHIQAKGGYTKHGVRTSGIVPFIRNIQSVVTSFMQSENRRGSAVIGCNWWHLDIEEFLELKDASAGTEENRALHLQYAFLKNEIYERAVDNNEDIYLLDPLDCPDLLNLSGEDFENRYDHYIQNTNIRRKKISAKELDNKHLKYYFQTGNMYSVNLDNVNVNMTNRYVGSSNLCCEILIPSRSGELIEEYIEMKQTDLEKTEVLHTEFKNEEIGLCNLASLNSSIFNLDIEEYERIVYIITKIVDNTIDIGKTMRVGGTYTNKKYRYIGIGISNYAYYLAEKEILFTDNKAKIATFKLFEKYSNSIILASSKLAKENGVYPAYLESKWSEGLLPYDIANKEMKKVFDKHIDMKQYNRVKESVKTYGVRNSLMMAIAPTATSATSKNLTEGIEPLMYKSYTLEGAVSSVVLAPDFNKLGQHYSLAYNIPQETSIFLACIRQMFIDQSQSFNLYISTENFQYDKLRKYIRLGSKLGLKTTYYLNTPKNDDHNSCESCSS